MEFEVESIPPYYKRAVGSSTRYPAGRTPKQDRVADGENHFWHMRSSQEEVLSQLRYRDHGGVLTTVHWWRNETNHISGASTEKRAVVTDDGVSGPFRALRPEQKGAVCVKGVIQMFMSPSKP